jgi:hypothetical protein
MAVSNWYSLASVTVDGANVGAADAYTFTNVQADQTIVANYAAMLAANNTPEWWLYQQNTNWATNFNAASLADPDGTGVPVWADYIAGTDPRNPASVFKVNVAFTNGQTIVSIPTIPTTDQYQLRRYYAIESTTNPSNPGSWQGLPGWTNIQGLGQVLAYTNASGNSNVFFRGKVWLGP